jgi:hypothetical protein
MVSDKDKEISKLKELLKEGQIYSTSKFTGPAYGKWKRKVERVLGENSKASEVHIFEKPFLENYVSPFCDPEILRCPVCRSEDVEHPYPKGGYYFKCRKCGYVDFFYGRWLKKKDEVYIKRD